MNAEELHILCDEETRCSIEHNIERTHHVVALDKSICNSRLVATQVKYLQRAKSKLPSYYTARCVISPLAFEQSSSEQTAECKVAMGVNGERLLDLTCGLGVESFVLSKKFDRVVAIERDEVVAAMARENFKRLGINNIEVVCSCAEEYIASCDEKFDWVMVDPDRRGAKGEKRVVLEDCSPNILEMMNRLRMIARKMVIKLSPLFDCDEARRLFPDSTIEVVSVGGECKEVVIYCDFEGTQKGEIIATMANKGSVSSSSCKEIGNTIQQPCTESFRHIIIPDVSLQKTKLATVVMGEIGYIESNNGYAFSTVEQIDKYDPTRHLGRVEEIEEIMKYEPKKIRKALSDRGIKRATIMKREFRHSTEQIKRQLKVEEGGEAKLLFTTLNGESIMVILR